MEIETHQAHYLLTRKFFNGPFGDNYCNEWSCWELNIPYKSKKALVEIMVADPERFRAAVLEIQAQDYMGHIKNGITFWKPFRLVMDHLIYAHPKLYLIDLETHATPPSIKLVWDRVTPKDMSDMPCSTPVQITGMKERYFVVRSGMMAMFEKPVQFDPQAGYYVSS